MKSKKINRNATYILVRKDEADPEPQTVTSQSVGWSRPPTKAIAEKILQSNVKEERKTWRRKTLQSRTFDFFLPTGS